MTPTCAGKTAFGGGEGGEALSSFFHFLSGICAWGKASGLGGDAVPGGVSSSAGSDYVAAAEGKAKEQLL